MVDNVRPPVTPNSDNYESDGSSDSVLENSSIIGYNFEPEASFRSGEDVDSQTDDDDENVAFNAQSRLDNKDWCKCNNPATYLKYIHSTKILNVCLLHDTVLHLSFMMVVFVLKLCF